VKAAGILIEVNCIPNRSTEPLCAISFGVYDLNTMYPLSAMFSSNKIQYIKLD
jgi:hypothetical protein